MILSIITVNFNNLPGLKSTFESLSACLASGRIRWVVVDGCSSDGSVEFLEEKLLLPEGRYITFLSEPDDGLYYAMNKGIGLSVSDSFLLFLNSGDLLGSDLIDMLKRPRLLAKRGKEYDVFIGASRRFSQDKVYVKLPRSIRNSATRMVCEHQAFIVKKSVLKDIRYHTEYKLSADFDFIGRILLSIDEGRIYITERVFCSFEFGGVSKLRRSEAILEDMLIRRRLYKFPFLMNMWYGLLHYLWDFAKTATGGVR